MKKSLATSTIAFPLPVWVIGSYDAAGRPNVMTAAWTGICCSQPPCVYFSVRPSRYTCECVRGRNAFTVNVPGAAQAQATDYFGCVSGRDADKFAASGLTPVRSHHVDAPYIAQFPFVLECQVIREVELGTHVMFIGEIKAVICDDAITGSDGKLDLAKLEPIMYSSATGSYHHVGGMLGSAYSLGRSLSGHSSE